MRARRLLRRKRRRNCHGPWIQEELHVETEATGAPHRREWQEARVLGEACRRDGVRDREQARWWRQEERQRPQEVEPQEPLRFPARREQAALAIARERDVGRVQVFAIPQLAGHLLML